MSLSFPSGDVMITYFKERWVSTQSRRVLAALSGYMKRVYADKHMSAGDVYFATCTELGAEA